MQSGNNPPPRRPNILVILADDMGFSDIGCFGSEIETPNIDKIAAMGTRMTSFYNVARCCPSRACLLTGVYPHQAGIGQMTRLTSLPGYKGYLLPQAATVADSLSLAGYYTWLSGKWHVGGDYAVHLKETWNAAGDSTHPLPTQRGFKRFYGTLGGAGSYYNPPQLMEQESFIEPDCQNYYYTDAITQKALQFIQEATAENEPFFGYLSYTAPHWPLHAPEAEIAQHRGRYNCGWDEIRQARLEKLIKLGLMTDDSSLSERDELSRPWNSEQHKEWEAERMAVYAAMITAMDKGIGEILDHLKKTDQLDNTLIVFLSDNGGCAEFLREDGTKGTWPEFYSLPMLNGAITTVGNRVGVAPGPEDTFMSYDLPWANASNTPFRKFKAWTHEGGISTPFIMSWPKGNIRTNHIDNNPAHLIDLTKTFLDAAGAQHPDQIRENATLPLEGISLLPLLSEQPNQNFCERLLCWEHQGHCAARKGEWKIVRAATSHPWELYHIQSDRIEQNDLASEFPEIVGSLASDYAAWCQRVGVVDFELVKKSN